MYCRTHKRRVEICEKYHIKPIGRFKLLEGRSVESDAGNEEITDQYVIFQTIDKADSTKLDKICCSPPIAKDICELSNTKMPSLFNPLKSDNDVTSSATSGNNTESKTQWNPTRKQLYECTLLLIAYFNPSPKYPTLFNIKSELDNPDEIQNHPERLVKSINSYLGKANTTFQAIVNELSKSNNLRQFRYNHILEYLKQNNIPQHFE